jgi:hypothetical protein
MSFTGNLGVTHGGIFIAYSRGGKRHPQSAQCTIISQSTAVTNILPVPAVA